MSSFGLDTDFLHPTTQGDGPHVWLDIITPNHRSQSSKQRIQSAESTAKTGLKAIAHGSHYDQVLTIIETCLALLLEMVKATSSKATIKEQYEILRLWRLGLGTEKRLLPGDPMSASQIYVMTLSCAIQLGELLQRKAVLSGFRENLQLTRQAEASRLPDFGNIPRRVFQYLESSMQDAREMLLRQQRSIRQQKASSPQQASGSEVATIADHDDSSGSSDENDNDLLEDFDEELAFRVGSLLELGPALERALTSAQPTFQVPYSEFPDAMSEGRRTPKPDRQFRFRSYSPHRENKDFTLFPYEAYPTLPFLSTSHATGSIASNVKRSLGSDSGYASRSDGSRSRLGKRDLPPTMFLPGQGYIPGWFKDLVSHMLTHQGERPEKCPIPTCPFYIKGFARKHDKKRHVLTHNARILVCGFCARLGSAPEKSFNRVDVFKRHLTSVHGVEELPPHAGRKRQTTTTSPAVLLQLEPVTCSTCGGKFNHPQDLYNHLDDCITAVIELAMQSHDTSTKSPKTGDLSRNAIPSPSKDS